MKESNNIDEVEINKLISELHRFQELGDESNIIISYFKISQYYYNHSNLKKAKQNLNSILELNPKTPRVNYYLAQISLFENKISEAIGYLNKELKINPMDPNAKILKKKLLIHNNFPIITIILFLLNSIIFYFTFPEINFIQILKFGLSSSYIHFSNIISSLFFHSNWIHFLFNIIVILMFGLILEKQIGSFKFLLIYLLSGIIGNLSQVLIVNDSFVIGASGAIFGIIGSLLIIRPRLELRLFGLIKIPLIILFGLYFIFSNLINNYFLNSIIIGDFAHIFGFLTGILITGILYKENIDVFYAWISITFGFYIINLGIEVIIKDFISLNLLINSSLFFIDILISLSLIFIGILLIFYSYKILKIMEFDD